MAERKALFEAKYISDHSCGTYTVGEIDSICDNQIKAYLDSYDEFGYNELVHFLTRCMGAAHSHMREIRMNRPDGSCQAGSQ